MYTQWLSRYMQHVETELHKFIRYMLLRNRYMQSAAHLGQNVQINAKYSVFGPKYINI